MIKEAREAAKLTQEELAQKSRVSRGTISVLENGTTKITTTKTLVNIAKALNTTIDKIFFADVV